MEPNIERTAREFNGNVVDVEGPNEGTKGKGEKRYVQWFSSMMEVPYGDFEVL